MASDGGSIVLRLVAGLLVGAAVVFAVQGGEYGTADLLRQRTKTAQVTRTVDSLRRIVDSLTRYKNAVEHDPATQERIAREVFGMVRGEKEVVYRLQP
jgi:cell division protein FtsB